MDNERDEEHDGLRRTDHRLGTIPYVILFNLTNCISFAFSMSFSMLPASMGRWPWMAVFIEAVLGFENDKQTTESRKHIRLFL